MINKKNDSDAESKKRKTWIRRILELIIAVTVFWFTFNATAEALRTLAIKQISQMTGAHVEADHIYFRINGSVLIDNITLRPMVDAGYDNAVFKTDQLYARFGILSLIRFKPQLKKIIVADFTVDFQNETDTDHWNFMDMKLNLPKGSASEMPIVRLKKGILKYTKITDGEQKLALEVPIEAKLSPDEQEKNCYSFYLATAKRTGYKKPCIIKGKIKPGSITLSGAISSAEIPAFENPWAIDVLALSVDYDAEKNFGLKFSMQDLQSQPAKNTEETIDSEKLLNRIGLLGALQNVFDRFNPSGQLDLNAKASGNLNDLKNIKFAGNVHCQGINFYDIKYPYKLNDLRGNIKFTDHSVILENLSAAHDDIDLKITGKVLNTDAGWDCDVKLLSDNMMLNDELFAILNPAQKKLWKVFNPFGRSGIKFGFRKEPSKPIEQTLTVDLKSISARCTYFPYPIENLFGRLVFNPSEVFVYNLVSKVGDRTLTFNGHLTGTNTPHPNYDVTIKADNIQLDSDLAHALPKDQSYLYEKFVEGGSGDAVIKVFSSTDGPKPITFIADLFFDTVIFKINESLVTISDIKNKTVFTPTTITLDNVQGIANHHGKVSLKGDIWPGKGAEELRYDISVGGENVLLEQSLFDLMPKSMDKYITMLQPSGSIDFLAELKKRRIEHDPKYKLTIDCRSSAVNFQPFPYPLKDIVGRIIIDKDIIELQNIKANSVNDIKISDQKHQIFAHGSINLVDNKFHHALFTFDANDILFDERLRLAVPQKFKTLYDKFAPTGRFSLDLDKIKVTTASNDKLFDIYGRLMLDSCSFTPEKSVSDLNANINVKTIYHQKKGILDAQSFINAPSLKVKTKQLTNMHANITYNPAEKLWIADDVIADCYDGKFAGGFRFKQIEQGPWQYLVDLSFGNIDLNKLIRKSTEQQPNSYTTGILGGTAAIKGIIGKDQTRLGSCCIEINDMKVGRVSPIADVLQMLKLDQPSDYVFEKLFANSYIKQNLILVDKLDLSGTTLAFNGHGWVDIITKEIALGLIARGSRLATVDPSVLQSLAEGIGATVLRVDVTGSYDDPKVEIKPLPVIEQTFEMITPYETFK